LIRAGEVAELAGCKKPHAGAAIIARFPLLNFAWRGNLLPHSIQGIMRLEVVGELRLHPAAALDHILAILLHGILTPAGHEALRLK